MSEKRIPGLHITVPRGQRRAASGRLRALRVVHTPDQEKKGRSLPLEGSAYVVGRAAAGPAQIEDPAVSRQHVRIVPIEPDGALIQDLGGANGTFVNGAQLKGAAPLHANTVIALGETILVVDEHPNFELLPANPGASSDEAAEFLGVSFFAERVRKSIATVAAASGSVLVLGESGTGKEVVARSIHRLSGRTGPLVSVNGAAIPVELAEAELFGHRRGAFTGAVQDRAGFFVEADGGTLFLDELGELALPVQAKLLRVLEERMVSPLGGGRPRPIDVRVVAATQVDLDASPFRRDLKARLGDWVLQLLPLAQRRVDILPLFESCWGPEPPAMSVEFVEALLLYAWPLNVRELLKLGARLKQLQGGAATLDVDVLPRAMQAPLHERGDEKETQGLPVPRATRVPSSTVPPSPPPDREALEQALREAKGNLRQVARTRGWHRTQLYRWIERYELDLDAYR